MLSTLILLFGCSGDEGGDAAGDDDDVVGDDDDIMGDDDDVVGDDDDDNGVPLIECTDPFTACGGDPSGLWDVRAICTVPLDTSALPCGGVTYDFTDDRSGGTIDFQGGGVYDRSYEVDIDFVVHVPDTCLVGPLSCDNLASLTGGVFDACTDTGTGICDCTGTLQELDEASGTWSVDGNEIVTDGTDRTEFCVMGSQGESQDEDGTRVLWSR